MGKLPHYIPQEHQRRHDFSLENNQKTVAFQIPTAVAVKSSVFWDIPSCGLVKVNRHFGGTYRLHLQGRRVSQAASKQSLPDAGFCIAYTSTLKMEAECPCETSVDFHRTTRRYITVDRTLQPKSASQIKSISSKKKKTLTAPTLKLKNLKPKGPGDDAINNTTLSIYQIRPQSTLNIFFRHASIFMFSNCLKKAKITTFHKSGNCPSLQEGHRPIIFVQTLSELLQQILLNTFRSNLESLQLFVRAILLPSKIVHNSSTQKNDTWNLRCF
jgi:hypothetical protein